MNPSHDEVPARCRQSKCRWCGAILLRERTNTFVPPEKVARHWRSLRHREAVERDKAELDRWNAMKVTVTR